MNSAILIIILITTNGTTKNINYTFQEFSSISKCELIKTNLININNKIVKLDNINTESYFTCFEK